MTTEKRTRVYYGENEEDRQEEDEKMEQFFALIRNFHRRKTELRQRVEIKNNIQSKMRRLDDGEQSCRVPTFAWADFSDDSEFRRPPPIVFPNPNNRKEDKEKPGEDDGLDLKLTL